MKRIFLLVFMAILLAGCAKSDQVDVNYTISKQDEALIEEYINQNLYEPVSDAKIHSIFEVLGSNMSKGELYLWVIVQEVDQERNKTGTILSGPVLLKVRQGEEGLQVLKHKEPGDGVQYNKDINKMFPEEVREKITYFDSAELMKQLEEQY